MIELIYGNDGKVDSKLKNGTYIDAENKDSVVFESAPDDVVTIINNYFSALSSVINNSMGNFDLISFIVPFIRSNNGNYTAAGLARNLKTDGRNGKMYEIMVDKKVSDDFLVDMSNTKFLTDVGFARFASNNMIDTEKQFNLGNVNVDIPKVNICKIVAKIFEAFALSAPIGSAAFMISDNLDSDNSKVSLNAKAIAVYNQILEYLPWSIRTRLTFAGPLDTSINQPSSIDRYKLIAYSMNNIDNAPKGCVGIINVQDETVPKRFMDIAEYIVGLDNDERKDLFELLKNNFENYSDNNCLYSEEYVYILDKINEWSDNGKEINLCIQDWLENKNMEYINKFPYLMKIVKSRLGNNIADFEAAIADEIVKCGRVVDIVNAYEEYVKLCNSFECDIKEIQSAAKARFFDILSTSTNIENLINDAGVCKNYADVFLDDEFDNIFYDLSCNLLAGIKSISDVILCSDKIMAWDTTDIIKRRNADFEQYVIEHFSGLVTNEVKEITKSVPDGRKFRELSVAYKKYIINKTNPTKTETLLNNYINEILQKLNTEVEKEIEQEFETEANNSIKLAGNYKDFNSNDIFKFIADKQEIIDDFVKEYASNYDDYPYVHKAFNKLFETYIFNIRKRIIYSIETEGISKEIVLSFRNNGTDVIEYLKNIKNSKYDFNKENINDILDIFEDIQFMDYIMKSTDKNKHDNTEAIIEFILGYFNENKKYTTSEKAFDKYFAPVLKKCSIELKSGNNNKSLKKEIDKIYKSISGDKRLKGLNYIYEFFNISNIPKDDDIVAKEKKHLNSANKKSRFPSRIVLIISLIAVIIISAVIIVLIVMSMVKSDGENVSEAFSNVSGAAVTIESVIEEETTVNETVPNVTTSLE